MTLYCIHLKVFFIIIVRLLLIGQVIVVNQHLWHAVSIKRKGHHIAIINCQAFMFICWMWNISYGGICPSPNSHVAHVTLESRGTHNTNGLYLNQIQKLILNITLIGIKCVLLNVFVKRRKKLEQIKVAQNMQKLFITSLNLSEFED